MENKFWLKNVEWRYEDYEHLGVRVWHLPTDIQCFLNNKKSYAHALFLALKSLEEKVNKYYENQEKEMTDYQYNPLKTGLDQQGTQEEKEEPVFVQMEIRTKALKLACDLYNTAYYDRSEGNKPIIDIAKRFYDYIIKGE